VITNTAIGGQWAGDTPEPPLEGKGEEKGGKTPSQWRINHESMEARASSPQFLGQTKKTAPHSNSVQIFDVINLLAGLHALPDIVT